MSGGGSSGGGSDGGSGGVGGGIGGGGAGGGGAGGGGIRGVSGPVPGPDANDGSNCNDPTAGGTDGIGGPDDSCNGAGGVGQYPGESEADRKARLEKTLEESVGGFDEVLAEEQREISTVGRNTEGFGGGAGGGGGAGSGRVGLGKQATGDVEGAGEVAKVAVPEKEREASIGELSEEEIRARTPDDIEDLVSDDIVAKQLKEAALSEDDPVLRERLWDEYRSYNDL